MKTLGIILILLISGCTPLTAKFNADSISVNGQRWLRTFDVSEEIKLDGSRKRRFTTEPFNLKWPKLPDIEIDS